MTAQPPDEVQQLRAAMDAVNSVLVLVLHQRAQMCRRIAACKVRLGLPLVDEARERAMLEAMLREDPGHDEGFPPAALERIVRAVLAESRALVEEAGRA